jgi:hypothetical protein
MDDATKAKVIDLLTDFVVTLAPDVCLLSMYGGTVLELVKDDLKSRIGGFYIYADHISLEFAKGVSLSDPLGILEGKGKFRRHIKLRTLDDARLEACKQFLKQAMVY